MGSVEKEKEGEKEKVQRGWDEGHIPEDDKGPGEPVETGKKKAAPRKKKAEDGEEKPKRSRAKAKVREDIVAVLWEHDVLTTCALRSLPSRAEGG